MPSEISTLQSQIPASQSSSPMSDNVRKCPVSNDSHPELAVPASSAPPPQINDPQFDLSASQLAAIDMILTGARYGTIAEKLDITPRTLYRWRTHDPAFRRHLDQRRRDLCQDTADRFRASLTSALDVLERQVRDPCVPTSLRAARTLLSLAAISKLLYPPPDE